MNITFVPLRTDYFPLMHRWFQAPLVRQWFARGQELSLEEITAKYAPRVEEKEEVFGFVARLEDKPVGYIQYYPLTFGLPDGVLNDHELLKTYPCEEMAGIDFFIGEASLVGKGFGPAMIGAFLNEVVFPKYRVVVTDPMRSNERAIRPCQKCGFVPFPGSQDSTFHLLVNTRDVGR